MPWPPNLRPLLLLLLLMAVLPCAAAPTAPTQKTAPAPTTPAPAIPDYGGRDAPLAPTAAAGTNTPSPLAQAGRSVEALVIVLAGIVGVLYLLKRAGLTGGTPPGAAVPPSLSRLKPLLAPKSTMPAANSAGPLNVVQSQPLPGAAGVTVHVLIVKDTTLLVGATPQGVSLLAQWDDDSKAPTPAEVRVEDVAFDTYLERAGIAPEMPPVQAVEQCIGATADRLQALLAGRRPEETR